MTDRIVVLDEITGKLKAVENIPSSYYITFNFNDLIAGSKIIGKVSPLKILERIDLIIENKFDSGVTISVGDSDNNFRIMNINENKPQHPSVYEKSLNYKYNTTTDVYLYFNGISTTGNGIVILHFN